MSELTLQTKSLSQTHLPLETVRLEVLEGEARGASALLTSGTLIAGGSSRADFAIRDATVSARHASFELMRGAVRVRDLQSRNGTFFLGARVDGAVVPLGSRLSLGRAVIALVPLAEQHRSEASRWHGLVADSAVMRSLLWRLESLAPSDVTVVIRGPSGVGKEAVARAVHLGGPRAKAPFEVFDAGGGERRAAGERALRAREGRVHRRERSARGAARARRSRHLVARQRRAARARAAAPAASLPGGVHRATRRRRRPPHRRRARARHRAAAAGVRGRAGPAAR